MDVARSAQDSELWAAACAGDGSAFAELFDRHSARVFRHVSRMVDDLHEAEDATATVFLELWRRRAAVRLVDGSVLPWLLVTATNVSRNARRTTRRYRAMLDRLPREASHSDPAQEVLERTSQVEPNLLAALQELRTVDLQVFALVVLEGFSVSDAARALDLTAGAARNRLHRSRQQLRRTVRASSSMTSLLEER